MWRRRAGRRCRAAGRAGSSPNRRFVGHLVDHVTHRPSVRCAGATAILRRHRYRQRRRGRAGDGAPPRRRRRRRHRRRRRQRAPPPSGAERAVHGRAVRVAGCRCTSARPPRSSSRSRPPSTSTVSTAWATSGCSCPGANRPTSTPSTPCSMRRTNTPERSRWSPSARSPTSPWRYNATPRCRSGSPAAW